MYFAVSHARTGSTFQLSCLTVNGELDMTFHPAEPVVSAAESAQYADNFVNLLQTVAGTSTSTGGGSTAGGSTAADGAKSDASGGDVEGGDGSGGGGGGGGGGSSGGGLPKSVENAVTVATLGIVTASIVAYLPAWSAFADEVATMKANMGDSPDFSAAIQFWFFFATMHPLLQPVLWISEVLHASPGPKVSWVFNFQQQQQPPHPPRPAPPPPH